MTCKHTNVVPYGDGDWGRCLSCGDDSFQMREFWPESLMSKLRKLIEPFLISKENSPVLIENLRRIIQDHRGDEELMPLAPEFDSES